MNPPPEEIEGEEEYEITEILSHQGSPGHQSYLVSWKGYLSTETPGNLNGTYNTPNHTQGVQTTEEPLKGLSCVIVWCKP